MIEDQRPSKAVDGAGSHPERRKVARIPIRRLAYINLEPHDNGGVITDLSKDGLRFHMVKPVEHGGLVRLSILLGAANQVEAVGQLIWLDPTRKVGGIQFTVLPAGAADEIIQWAQTLSSTPASESHPPSGSGKVQNLSISNEAPSESTAPSAAKRNDVPIANRPSAPAGVMQAVAPTPVRSTWAPPTSQPSAGAANYARDQVHSPDSREPQAAAPQQWANPGAHQQPAGIPRQVTAIPPQSTSTPGAMPWITHFDPDPAPRGSAFLRGVLGGVILCAILAAGAWFGMRHYGWQSGLISFGNAGGNASGNAGPASGVTSPVRPTSVQSGPYSPLPSADVSSAPNSDVTPEEREPAPAQNVPRASAANRQAGSNVRTSGDADTPVPNRAKAQPAGIPPASDSTKASTPQADASEPAPATTPSADKGTSATNPQHIASASASQHPQAPDSGESQLQLAREYLDGRGRPRNATVASQLLWSAVEKGNSTAEMDLADLYLHGDGVARNCAQARVLLSVASQKGNPEATQKLSNLERTGCR